MTANELAEIADGLSCEIPIREWIDNEPKNVMNDIATMLRQQQAEIERLTMLCDCMTTESNRKGNEIEELKQIIDANNLSQNIGQFVKAANEPVAWIDPKELDMDVSTSVTKNKQFESDIPLYVQPQKYCPSENNEAYEKGFTDGMAKQRDSRVQQMVEGYAQFRELSDEEIESAYWSLVGKQHEGKIASYLYNFARDILQKAREK